MSGEWVEAVGAAFGGLKAPHVEKKKSTIIALVDARLAGKAEESVWRQPGVCNRGTYHLKWKRQEDFAAALEAVTRLATDWKDTRAVRALQEAAESLALAAPLAAKKAMILMASHDDAVALRAAFGILDRAGVETASKAQPAGVQVIEVVKDYGASDGSGGADGSAAGDASARGEGGGADAAAFAPGADGGVG